MLTYLLKQSRIRFGGKKAQEVENRLQENAAILKDQRIEIEKQLLEVDKLNEELSIAVKDTQDISNELIYKLDHELSLAKRQLNSVSKSLSDGLIFLDHLGRILHFNAAAEKMLGINCDDVMGKNVISLFKPVNPAHEKSLPEAVIARCSRVIFSKIKAGESIEGESIANVAKIGRSSIIETWTPWGAYKFNMFLNVLEPNPNKASDVSYVCIFRPFGRRAID